MTAEDLLNDEEFLASAVPRAIQMVDAKMASLGRTATKEQRETMIRNTVVDLATNPQPIALPV